MTSLIRNTFRKLTLTKGPLYGYAGISNKSVILSCINNQSTGRNYTSNRQTCAPTITLNDGYKMPIFGLGTWLGRDREIEEAVKVAIDCGYRHIDTAFFYGNEKQIGRAVRQKIKEGSIKREDLFIVTKLWNVYHDPEKVEHAFNLSLTNLDLGYIDLYLMHFPVGYAYVDDDNLLPKDVKGNLLMSDYDYVDTYKEMEKLIKGNNVRSLGISNFNAEQTDRLLKNCIIKPVTNQVECHAALNQKELIKFSKDREIIITAYCPLARINREEKRPFFLFDEKIKNIAAKHKKTPAQIALRYLVEIGTIPIPKSTNINRIKENIDIFDFALSENELEIMESYNINERINPFPLVKTQNHKYYPFNTKF